MEYLTESPVRTLGLIVVVMAIILFRKTLNRLKTKAIAQNSNKESSIHLPGKPRYWIVLLLVIVSVAAIYFVATRYGSSIKTLSITSAHFIIAAILVTWIGIRIKKEYRKVGNAIETIGIVVIILTILTGGFGEIVIKQYNKASEFASCEADPTQQACMEAAAKQAAIKAEAAARADLQKQTSQPKPEVLTSHCGAEFSAVTNCVKVTFRNGGVYQRTAKKDMCLGYDKKSLIKEEPLGDSTYRYSSRHNGDVTVHFYDKKLGQYFDDSMCD